MPGAADIVGRDDERAVIDRWLQAVRPSALVLEGEAGIGKSTLWTYAIEEARRRGLGLLRWRASVAEQDLAFAALIGLFGGTAAEEAIGGLAPLRRAALDVALARTEVRTSRIDPAALGLAVADVLGLLARQRDLLVAIDDTQWCDAPSRDALAFAARRLGTHGVGFLFATRSGAEEVGFGRHGEALSTERIRLGPLSVGALGRLIRQRLQLTHARPVLLRIHETCAGNPFVALELSRLLATRRRELRPGEPLPVPSETGSIVRGRLAELSPAARKALVIVAMSSLPTLALIDRVLGIDAGDAVDEAFRRGVLVLDDDILRATHPLYASTAYEDTPPGERRALRRELAALSRDPLERAIHLAEATDGPDAGVAAQLESAAQTALGRGAPGVAASLVERALDLVAEPTRRFELQLDAADYLVRAGDPRRAIELLRGILTGTPSERVRALALLALGEIVYVDSPATALPLLLEALAHAGGDPLVEAAAHAHIAALADTEPSLAESSALVAMEILGRPGVEPGSDLLACALFERAYMRLLRCDSMDTADIERATPLLTNELDSFFARRARSVQVRWLSRVGRAREALALEEAEYRRLVERGDVGLLPPLLQSMSTSAWLTGDWARAQDLANECAELAEQGQESSVALATMARVQMLAWTGDLAQARLLAQEAVAREEDAGDWWDAAVFRSHLGFVALSAGEPRAALEHLLQARDHADRLDVAMPTVFRYLGNLVEAAVRAGDLELAEAVLVERLEGPAERIPVPWIVGMASRGRGLLSAARGRAPEALEWFDRSVVAFEAGEGIPHERGRSLLQRGALRRRLGQRQAARVDLESARAIFEELGATALLAQTLAEHRRIAGRAPTPLALTDAERRVAELAARGRSNREIAAELVVSVRTVESQLAAAYRKLDVTSRSQLAASASAWNLDGRRAL